MKRCCAQLRLDDLNRSIGCYAQLFAAQPTRVEDDYAKWLLESPAGQLRHLHAQRQARLTEEPVGVERLRALANGKIS